MNNNTKARWKRTTKAERVAAAKVPRKSRRAKVGAPTKEKSTE